MSNWATSVPKRSSTTKRTDLQEVQTVSSGGLTTTTKVLIGVGVGTVVFLGVSAAVIFTTLALTHTGPFSTTTSTTSTTLPTAAASTSPATTASTTTLPLTNCSTGVYANTSGSCTTLGTAFNCSSTVSLCGSQASTSGGGVFWVGTSGYFDDNALTATIPFNVSLYGVSSTMIGTSTNAAFCVGACSSFAGHSTLPTSSFSTPTVFLLWEDLAIFSGTTQTVRYGIVGSAPSRMLVVEYYLASLYAVNHVNQMFLVMYENVPDIVRVEYVYTYNSAALATVGVQKTGSGPSIQYGYNQAVINNGSVLIYNTFSRVYSG